MSRISTVAACAAAALVAASPAAAQSNPPIGGVFDAISSDQLVALFTGAGINARYLQYESETHFVQVSEGGVTIAMVGLRGCDGATSASRCKMVQPFTLFDGAGLTLAAANQLNLEKFGLASLMLLPDGNAVIGIKLLLDGGVTEANLRNNLGVFFADLATFAKSVTPGVIARVSVAKDSPFGYPMMVKALPATEGGVHALGTGAIAADALSDRLQTAPQ